MQLSDSWDCTLENVDHFIHVQDTVIVSLGNEGISVGRMAKGVNIAQLGLGRFLVVGF